MYGTSGSPFYLFSKCPLIVQYLVYFNKILKQKALLKENNADRPHYFFKLE